MKRITLLMNGMRMKMEAMIKAMMKRFKILL